MNKKLLSIVMAGAITMGLIHPVFATPNEEIIENQRKYEELNSKIEEIQGEVFKLNEQIMPLSDKIEENNKQIDNIKQEIKNTNKEIETAKVEIAEKEEILGNRLRELYKSGGQVNYLALIFSAESFSDLITKLDSAAKLISIDKEIVNDLKEKKESLDEKINSLQVKADEITKINEETNKVLEEFEEKKKEQEELIAQIEAERAKFDEEFLSVSERELVSYQIDVINSSSSISELQSAASQLTNIKDYQLKSPTVIQEVEDAIYAATLKIEELQAQEEAERLSANRGQTYSGSSSSIVSYAYQFIGTPYVYGATGPSAFDCSGFTSYVFRNAAGIEISRTTYSQVGVGQEVSYGELQPGDLVFTYGLDHVGIYVGNGQYIHAPYPGESVKVSPITSFYTARRVIN
ncbi:NlpC/P60 family protein [Clostridium isatidis]|uniref:Glycoside hydrolase n=1 Tax=Clostridium isatidis TaxID=182773 RepID=A0A343JFH4_9CLOT|nr:C40 family peptidase [Clostridium isatidis]ASW44282.1 glycoside hydrolase [Clostridium isatidis]NLZ33537.1 glycoside hydrolase [Clostridiales bacterium]